MIKIDSCPSTLISGYSSYAPKASKRLFGRLNVSPFLDFEIGQNRGDDFFTVQKISISGVQNKLPALIERGKIRLARGEERSTHILKPVPTDSALVDRSQIPANEHLTMQIASQVYGIETAVNGLCFTPKGRPVFITSRFDITTEGDKLQMEDFAALTERNEISKGMNFKYEGSYEDIALCIRKYVSAWRVDMERFFELVVFNYIYGNADAHLKNFSLIIRGSDFRLAPAYDLLNTSLHLEGDDFALEDGLSNELEKSDIYERTGHPCQEDFLNFGLKIGLEENRVLNIINKFSSLPDRAKILIEDSFLNKKSKRNYLRIITERTKRFNR